MPGGHWKQGRVGAACCDTRGPAVQQIEDGCGSVWLGERSQLMTSPWGRKEKSRACIWGSGFSEGCPRDLLLSHLTQGAILSHLTQGANRELAYFGCLGQWEKERAERLAAIAQQNLLYHRQTPEGARDYELLKKKPGNLSNWEITLTNSENCQSAKDVSDAPWISS